MRRAIFSGNEAAPSGSVRSRRVRLSQVSRYAEQRHVVVLLCSTYRKPKAAITRERCCG